MATSTAGVDRARIERLLGRCRGRIGGEPATAGTRYRQERAVLFVEAFQETPDVPVPLRWARAVDHVLRSVAIAILPDEVIVGEPAARAVDSEEASRALAYLAEYRLRRVRTLETYAAERLYSEVGLSSTWHAREGHNILAYGEILGRGVGGLRRQAEAALISILSEAPGSGPAETGQGTPRGVGKCGDPRVAFYEASLVVLEGLAAFIRRHAALAREMAASAPPDRSADLLAIAETCEHLAGGRPARSFREALQLVWLAHIASKLDDGGVGHSFGRLDQYLYPYYRADLESRRATADELLDLLVAFWIKVNSEYEDTSHLQVGGVDAAGADASNDLTYACLEAQRRVGLTQPELSARVHQGTPERLWREIAETVRPGGGQPAVYNDAIQVPGLVRLGVPLEIARDYTKVGCIETYFAGRCTPWVGLYVNGAKCLELAITGGRCLTTGKMVGRPGPGAVGIRSFGELLAEVDARLYEVTQLALRGKTLFDELLPTFQAAPLQSALTPCALERGRDLYDGGAEYTVTGPYLVGLATTVDALAAIRRLVFEDRVLCLSDLVEVLGDDFAGREALRLRLLNQPPKYGNDEDAVDLLAEHLVEVLYRATVEMPAKPGYLRMPVVAASTTAHVTMGARTGASADGRRKGEPLSEGSTPGQGRSRLGATAALRSLAKVDHTLLGGGEAVTLTLSPSVIQGEGGPAALVALLKGYFVSGGAQIQVNVVGRETLRAARRDPRSYRHLVVRVSGYSAYFTALDPSLQDEIISRTEYAF